MDLAKFKKLTSSRLVLRALKTIDISNIFALRSDAALRKYILSPLHKNEQESLDFITRITNGNKKQKHYFWGITLNNTDKLIGTICLWNFSKDKKTAEIGYDLFASQHNKGIMSEAIQTVLKFGFEEAHFQTIEAFTHRTMKPLKHC
jgi:ribosomal-protein-alanine N-acetyltransferase